MESALNISVTIYPLMPYTRIDIIDGKIEAAGCIGMLWTELTDQLPYKINSIYSLENTEATDVVLSGGTDLQPAGAFITFLSSWYEMHIIEESSIINLSYMVGYGLMGTVALMIFIYAILLYFVLKCAEKYFPASAVDLPSVKQGPMQNYQKMFPKWKTQALLHRRLRVQNEESFGNCLMGSIAAVSNQGSYLFSHVSAIRVAILAFLLFGLVINSAYSAMLISKFTAKQSQDLTDDWVTFGNTKVCVRTNGLPNAHNSKITKLMEMNFDETCAAQLCEGIPVYESAEVMHSRHYQCQYKSVRSKSSFVFHLGIEVTDKAPEQLRTHLRERMIQFRENGLASRIAGKWLRKKETVLSGEQEHVSLTEAKAPFVVILVALVISAVVYGLEKAVYRGHTWIE